MIEEHGPYVVIAPGLALAHARPGPEVLSDGLAVVTLSTPVPFGHPHNDPVNVVLALAVHSPERHLRMVAELANLFNDSDAVQRLADARVGRPGARDPGRGGLSRTRRSRPYASSSARMPASSCARAAPAAARRSAPLPSSETVSR